MLVQFDSKAGQFFMDGDVAVQLLKWMGHSGTIPGALLAADVGPARTRLEEALTAQPAAAPGVAAEDDDGEQREPRISLRQRAFPLLELLERAARQRCDVLWDRL